MIYRQQPREAAKKRHIEVIDLRSPPVQDKLKESLCKLIDGTVTVAAVFLPSDTHVFTHAKYIGEKLGAANIKTIGSLERYVKDGALIGMVPVITRLGRLLLPLSTDIGKANPCKISRCNGANRA